MININRHVSPSKGVKVTIIALAEEEKLIMKKAFVSSLSPLGFKLIFHNRNFISEKLQTNFYNLWQKELYMYIPDMEIDLNGVITGGRYLKNGKWEVNVEFPSSTPQYWRECLYDLWPSQPQNELSM